MEYYKKVPSIIIIIVRNFAAANNGFYVRYCL